ncbi:TRI25 ligase, partial [Atractosteus spatula]|nr:TRI25 ligase [Atractosteus spatula]
LPEHRGGGERGSRTERENDGKAEAETQILKEKRRGTEKDEALQDNRGRESRTGIIQVSGSELKGDGQTGHRAGTLPMPVFTRTGPFGISAGSREEAMWISTVAVSPEDTEHPAAGRACQLRIVRHQAGFASALPADRLTGHRVASERASLSSCFPQQKSTAASAPFSSSWPTEPGLSLSAQESECEQPARGGACSPAPCSGSEGGTRSVQELQPQAPGLFESCHRTESPTQQAVIGWAAPAPGVGRESWGYVDVRDGAHMFWWLYYSNNPSKNFTQLPLVMWLQGGPGGSGCGFGNFEEIGPLDRDLRARNTTWVQAASVLFVDNPVGTGYSYTDSEGALAGDVATVASDMMVLLTAFFKAQPEFQSVPFYIFSESYGGKMASAISLSLHEAVQKGLIKCRFAGVALGDSWISPLDSVLSWGPYLYSTSLLDDRGLEEVNAAAMAVKQAMEQGDFQKATELWSNTETVVEQNTNGVNFYNILTQDPDEARKAVANNGYRDRLQQSGEPLPAPGPSFLTEISLQRRCLSPLHGQTLSQLMNGPIRDKLKIIPSKVTWGAETGALGGCVSVRGVRAGEGRSRDPPPSALVRREEGWGTGGGPSLPWLEGAVSPAGSWLGGSGFSCGLLQWDRCQASDVFISMEGDFMKPVVDIVDQLLAAGVNVTVYNGQLDLIVDTMGQEAWVKRLKWAGLPAFSQLRWTAVDDPASHGQTGAFYKTYQNFAFYWILKAGHMVTLHSHPDDPFGPGRDGPGDAEDGDAAGVTRAEANGAIAGHRRQSCPLTVTTATPSHSVRHAAAPVSLKPRKTSLWRRVRESARTDSELQTQPRCSRAVTTDLALASAGRAQETRQRTVSRAAVSPRRCAGKTSTQPLPPRAAMASPPSPLLSLAEELTCSICLSTFDSPVTTPCGHNFCRGCLEATWQESQQVALGYNCPQCRTHFYSKPELRKNTVLSTVVDTFTRAQPEHREEPEPESVLCDTCLRVRACNTCLTCMASFCPEHVRPHQESPAFQAHQLGAPLADLQEHLCAEHCKLLEFFCLQHRRAICSLCLQLTHKPCRFSTPQEQRAEQEAKLTEKLTLLSEKIEKTQTVISQMKELQSSVRESAESRKKVLAELYRQMKEMLEKDERETLRAVDHEQEGAQTRILGLMQRMSMNVEEMAGAKGRVETLLAQKHKISFLQTMVELPQVVTFNPYVPRINIDSKQVLSCQTAAVALKHFLGNLLEQPVEGRPQLLRPGKQPSKPAPGDPAKIQEPSKTPVPPRPKESKFTLGPVGETLTVHVRKKTQKSKMDLWDRALGTPLPQSTTAHGPAARHSFLQALSLEEQPLCAEHCPANPLTSHCVAGSNRDYLTKDPLLNNPIAKRSDLLQHATVLTLDLRTAHRRLVLSENFTRATVSEEQASYHDSPARFSMCSQVLCFKGFSRGRHYWEVKLTSSNFCAVGLAYNSIDRKGPSSRLGRNKQSWCLEWFNVKLSAWHGGAETVLFNPSPSRVGVLLDCDEGTATFYNVADRAYPIHTFTASFTEAVYPAFWLFSSGTTLTLCKLAN